MALNVNEVRIAGHLGKVPELKQLPGGEVVVALSLATTRRWRDKASNEQKEHTEWHRVVCYGNTAKAIAEHAQKGSALYFEGELRYRDYTPNEPGAGKRTIAEVIANRFQFVESKRTTSAGPSSDVSADNKQSASAEFSKGGNSEPADEFDFEDIPF